MNTYNFLNLSSAEFENLSRDLLQKKLNIFLESFTSGPDGGIDLRSSSNQTGELVVQSKRYKDYGSLKSTLKKELKKVEKLNPNRYILTTSAGLTPQNKNEILKIFKPFISSTEDILGREDLNNLIGQNSDIEKKYYKLWLSSTSILQKIINSTVYNQSKFEFEEIKETLKTYVQNDSFKEALTILEKNKYVIISGNPGIGKTTLSRMLVYHLLAKGFDEFVFISENISEAYSYYEDGKSQVFFFDDFLGQNFLETSLSRNEDSKIIKFIERVKKSKNKIFILSTREYILNQAKSSFEALNSPTLEFAKCIIELSKYTKKIRAQILYNHLFFAKIPTNYLENLIKDKNYIKLIDHKNYSPRIIETFVEKQFWQNCEYYKFSKKIISFFDNPTGVWLHAFENTISKGAQLTLLVLSTIGTPVLFQDLRLALNNFINTNRSKYNITIDSVEFRKIIKELENTFIISKMDNSKSIGLEFKNPSIQDFLLNYIANKNELITELISSFSFISQFFRIFTFKNEKKGKILLDKKFIELYVSRITSDLYTLKTSRIIQLHYKDILGFKWSKIESSFYTFLNDISVEIDESMSYKLYTFIKKEFNKNIIPKELNYDERKSFIKLFRNADRNKFSSKIKESIIKQFMDSLYSFESLKDFSKLEDLISKEYNKYIKQSNFKDKIVGFIDNQIDAAESSQYKEIIEDIQEAEGIFSFSFDNQINFLTEKYEEWEKLDDFKREFQDDYSSDVKDAEKEVEFENNYIDELFNGLID